MPITRMMTTKRGCRLALHDLGGRGAPVFVCHATGFHGGAYRPLADLLVDAGWHVYALDLPGHGASEPPPHLDFAWTAMAGDFLDVLDDLGLASVRLFGHSMGGAVGLVAALDRPGSVLSAFVYEPIVYPITDLDSRPENPLAAPARRRREVFPSRAEAFQRYASRPPLDVFRSDALVAYVQDGFDDEPDGTVRLRCRGEYEARTYESDRTGVLERAGEITVPVVVAVGSGSEASPASLGAVLVGRLPHGRLIRYPALGHFGPFQAPALVAADILTAFGPASEAEQ